MFSGCKGYRSSAPYQPVPSCAEELGSKMVAAPLKWIGAARRPPLASIAVLRGGGAALPTSTNLIGEKLCKQQIARTNFDVSGILAILRLLDEDDLFDIVSVV